MQAYSLEQFKGSQMMVSVIVVNYFSADCLPTCAESLAGSNHELIIVDNSVDAAEQTALKSLSQTFDVKHLLFNTQNLGFARAVNQGAKLAQGEALLIINPDAYLLKNTLQNLVTELFKDGVGAVGPLIQFPDGTEQAGARRQTPTPSKSFAKLFGLSRLGLMKDHNLAGTALPTIPEAVEALSGACMLIKKELFWQLKGFDETYVMHCEDLDLCMRIRLAGFKLMFVPTALVIHEKGHSSHKRPLWVEWHLHRGMLIYYRKFFRKLYSPLLWLGIEGLVYLRFAAISLMHLPSLLFKR
jgi:GT2 family glycosyltransferase